ncbi:uncharacterized protein [Anabrus simplex]|uniref:uncharacterized protein n=1 Tax=Anabrus simplex TaxID=316456 RepID=UPI0035A2F6F6
MKYIAATISDAGGSSSLAERNSHIPSPKQRSFVQNNETSENFPFMRKDKSRVKKDSSTDPHHSSGLLAIENDPGNKDKSKGDPFEPSPIVRTNIKKSISRFRMSKEKKNEVGKPPIKTTSESLLCKSIIFPVGTKNTDKENLLSLPAKGRTNNVSGLSQSLQKNQDLGKAKEMNQERMNQIEENLRKEQKKPRTIQEYIEALKMAENQKPKKPPKPKPPIDPDFLVNGKVYRPPPFKKPKPWVTKQLINTLLKHCEKKYGPIRKRRKAEEFLVVLCKEVSNAIRRPKNYLTSVENTKRMLYKFGLIKNLHEHYCFIEDYLPPEFRYKAIPCLRAFGKTTGPPWIPGTNIFLELEFD